MIGSENNGMYMPVAPAYGSGCNNGFGNDWFSIIILFLIFGMYGNGGWGNGFGGNNQLGYDFPWLMNGQNAINSNTNNGFRDAMINDGINGIQSAVTSGFGDIQTALCGGFAGVNATVNGAQNALAQQLYTNQIADLERSYGAQTASTQGFMNLQSQLAQCCCENRAATNDVKYTLATEACATRNTDTQNTQSILNAINGGIQSIKDQMCQDKIDSKNDTIDQLRQELLYSRGQASQVAQTAAIEQYVRPTPAPAYIVANPYCNYNQAYGCGCGA